MAEKEGGRLREADSGSDTRRRGKIVREVVLRFTDGTEQTFRPRDPLREQSEGTLYGVDF